MTNYKTLETIDFSSIYKTMIEAFSDYALDMTYMQEHNLYNRAIKNGIDFSLSAGVFENDKLVGFTLVGIDEWEGEKSAFDIATGIVKEHRGKGHAKKIFDFITSDIKCGVIFSRNI